MTLKSWKLFCCPAIAQKGPSDKRKRDEKERERQKELKKKKKIEIGLVDKV